MRRVWITASDETALPGNPHTEDWGVEGGFLGRRCPPSPSECGQKCVESVQGLAPTCGLGMDVPETAAKHKCDVVPVVRLDEAGPAVSVHVGPVHELIEVNWNTGV